MITALHAWLALHEGTNLVLTRGARLCRVIEVREKDQECLVKTEDGRNLNRDWQDLYATSDLNKIEEKFRSNKPRPSYHGATLIAAIPMNALSLDAGYVVVVRRFERKVAGVFIGDYIGFYAERLGEPTWGQGHYFNELNAALLWATTRAGLVRTA